MEQAIGGHGVAAFVGSPSGEVREASTGLLDDDQWRSQVPRIDLGFEHLLTDPFRDQRVAPEIAKAAIAPRRAGHGVESALLADRNEGGQRGVKYLRLP